MRKIFDNNIVEHHCSFELCVLLKEKGFDVTTKDWYQNNGQILVQSGINGVRQFFKNTRDNCGGLYTSAPTHSVVIEWIKINFGIWIWVASRTDYFSETKHETLFIAHGRKIPDNIVNGFVKDLILYTPKKTSFDATEYGITYVLTNLI